MLSALSGLVAQHAQQLRALLRGVTALDVASARARHAAWLGATQPPRFLSAEEAAAGGPVQLPRAWHPLLLQPCLPPLPPLLLPDDSPAQQQEDALRCVCQGPCREGASTGPLLAWQSDSLHRTTSQRPVPAF